MRNFGDQLSPVVVERLVGYRVEVADDGFKPDRVRLLAIGSILHLAREGDFVWGTGVNGNYQCAIKYRFTNLFIKAVRGPLTRKFLMDELNVACPEIFGDPALLLPELYPDIRRRPPEGDFIIIVHYVDKYFFPKDRGNVYYADEDDWTMIVSAIVGAGLVISTSLHGLIIAEAYGIPARWLRISEHEAVFKFKDYYEGTGRSRSDFAQSVDEALYMGGADPMQCDLGLLRSVFPMEIF